MAWAFGCSSLWLLALIVLHRHGRSRLHGVILLALVSKCAVMVALSQDMQVVARTGRATAATQFPLQLLKQAQLVVEVLLFYLIGLGWKVTRPHLKASQWAFAASIGVLSFSLGSMEAACEAMGTCKRQNYLLTQFTLHSLCFLVGIVATNVNIFVLQRHIHEALAAPETSQLYAKHGAYCWFRMVFLYLVVVPTLTNILDLHVVHWDELWVVMLVRQGSLWIIYTAVLWLFRPGLAVLPVFNLAVVESSDSGSDSAE